ncbi:MAG: acylneuraminate cytidylyltransferase family protein [Lachnospiraceae bacterium]|nr:acylneuraminate cytidylyltransferase family protein [Lachnospiraceae bacterium]
MNTLAVITARSGSKGIKNKNIRQLNGKPLIAYTIESALQSHYIDEVMVSTDSDVYADIAKKFGAVVPFLRSNRNSEDMSKSVDVLLEVLDEYEKREKYFDNIVMLQPTSPLRTYKNLNEAFDLFYEKNADSVVSVCECEHSPLLSGILPDDWSLFEFIKSENNLRRQELQKFYRLNGAIYISKVTALKEIRSFYGENSYAYIMKQRESIDIDTELDFEYADFLLKRQNG